jgi:ribosomal protein L16 Arg81 hydroxylase
MTVERHSQTRQEAAHYRSVLGALVAPLSIHHFLRDYWPERVYFGEGALSRLPGLFSTPELSSFGALTAHYRGWLGFGRGSQSPRMISVQQVNPHHLYAIGLSVYLPDIEPAVDGASAFLRQLEVELGIAEGSARITVWASPKGDGASTHFDGEDVFSIQLAGTKRFEVAPMNEYANPVGSQFAPGAPAYDDMYPQIENGFPDASRAQFQAYDMKPGSVLFIPRGTWHRTTAAQDSFAVSIGINPPTIAESFLDQLRHLLLQDPQWRKPLYGMRGQPRQTDAALAQILQTAPRALQAISPRDLVPVTDIERLRNIERNTRFQRQPGTRIEFRAGAGAHMLEVWVTDLDAGEKLSMKMQVTPEYAETMRWIADVKKPFSAGDFHDRFPASTFEQHCKVLDVLTRAKYLRVLWFPRLPKD